MTSEFKGAKVEIGDVFYYKENSIILEKPEIVTVIEISSNNSEASYENYGVKLKSPYGYDYDSFAVDDLTRLGDDKLTYIGNKYTDKFIEVSDVTGEVIGEIKIGTPFSKDNHIEAANLNNIAVSDYGFDPVAYFNKFKNNSSNVTRQKVTNNRMLLSSTPLYTSDQLQNKIELTKDEFELLAKVCRGIQPFQKIEQHIKIVQEKKWFVKLKKEAKEFNMLYIDEGGFHYHQNKEYATYFDTKE